MNDILKILITTGAFMILIGLIYGGYRLKKGRKQVNTAITKKRCKHFWTLLGNPFDHKIKLVSGNWKYIVCQGYECNKCAMLQYVRVPSNSALEYLEREKYDRE